MTLAASPLTVLSPAPEFALVGPPSLNVLLPAVGRPLVERACIWP